MLRKNGIRGAETIAAVLLIISVLLTSGCSSGTEKDSSSAYAFSESSSVDNAYYGDDGNPESSIDGEEPGEKASSAEKESGAQVSDAKKSRVRQIFISDKPLEGFDTAKLNYNVILDDKVNSPPKVTALQSNGTGELKITQASGINGSAYVTLNGVTYTVKFSKTDKSNMLKNTYYKLCKRKKLRVAYFGGSITYGTGSTDAGTYSWRARTTSWLKKKFPNADIKETNAAIGGTGTAYGVYRAVNDLKLTSETEKPDLVFIEFAINDIYDGTDTETAKANLECIIRTIYNYAPDADIVMVLTTDQACMNNDFAMKAAHRSVAEAYGIPYITVGARLWDEMLAENNGQYPTAEIYSKYFSDTVHPANGGHAKYAEYITEYLNSTFIAKEKIPSGCENSYMPAKPLKELPVSPTASNFKGQTAVTGINIDNNGFVTSNTAGTSFSFTFTGTELKLWIWGTSTSGRLSVSIDGGEAVTAELYREYTNHGICPIASGLESKTHTATVTLESSSHGTAMDIRYFLVSGSQGSKGVQLINQ